MTADQDPRIAGMTLEEIRRQVEGRGNGYPILDIDEHTVIETRDITIALCDEVALLRGLLRDSNQAHQEDFNEQDTRIGVLQSDVELRDLRIERLRAEVQRVDMELLTARRELQALQKERAP